MEHSVHVRLTVEQYEWLLRRKREQGIPASESIRRALDHEMARSKRCAAVAALPVEVHL